MAMSAMEAILQSMIDGTEYPLEPQSRVEALLLELKDVIAAGGGGGGGGTTNYNVLTNKPQIAGTTLQGNKTLAQLGIASTTDVIQRLMPVATLPDTLTNRMIIMWCNDDTALFKEGGVYIYDLPTTSWLTLYEPKAAEVESLTTEQLNTLLSILD